MRKYFKSPAQYRAETGPRLQPTGVGGPSRGVGWNAGWATAWQPSLAGQPAYAACCSAHAPRARRCDHHAQTVRGTARWRARRRLGGGSTVARCCWRSRGGHGEGTGQEGEGSGAPERWVGGVAAQTMSGGGVRRPGGGSGWWRWWVWGLAAPERQGGEKIARNCRDW
jgi:hypothetical protein